MSSLAKTGVAVAAEKVGREVLVLAYQFPPDGGSIQRITKHTRYLPEFGWKPVVITHEIPCADVDASLPAEVIRRGNPQGITTRVAARVRGLLAGGANKAPMATAVGATSTAARPATTKLARAIYHGAKAWLAWPDDRAWWIWHATRAGLKRIRKGGIEAIYVVMAPHSSSLAGVLLKRLTGLPLIVDLRDPWANNTNIVMPTPLHRALHRWAEKLVFRTADRVVTTTDTHSEYVRTRIGAEQASKVVTITNGYDPADIPAAQEVDREAFVIAHAGSFYASRMPHAFFRALSLVFEQHPELRGRIKVRLIGQEHPAVTAEIARVGLREAVEWAGYMKHDQALREMARATVLLLVVHDDAEIASSAIPAKLFEYMGVRRPVLAISPDGPAARLVESTHCGVVRGHESPQAIADTIVTMYDDHRAQRLRSNITEADLRCFQRRSLSGALATLFGEVTSQYAGSAAPATAVEMTESRW